MSQGQLPELDSRPQSRREWTGWLSSLVLPLAFVMAVVLGLYYLQTSGDDEQGDSSFGTVELPAARNPTGQPPHAEAGRAAPDFILEALNGEAVRLSDLQGRPVIVSFFVTWSSDCRALMPAIAQLATAHGDVVVLAINLQESDGRVQTFAGDYGLDLPVLLDRRGDVSSTWRVGGRDEPLPATVFIDPTGVVRQVVEGPATAAELEQGLSLIGGGGE